MTLRIGLMFAGQGAQQPGMGQDLHTDFACVRALFSEADGILGRSLSNLCFNCRMEDLTACANCQPAIFTVSLACYHALQEVYPFTAVASAGLSLGEYAALQVAGVYDFASTLKLVSERGRLMDLACQQQAGGMAAILGAEQSLLDEICQRHGLEIANYNSPGQVIISGESQVLDKAVQELTAAGLKAIRLQVAGAFHSRLMSSAMDDFAELLRNYPAAVPKFLFAQNFSGTLVSNPEELRRNLLYQISGSVRWESCFRLLSQHCDVLIELGPGTVLTGLARRMERTKPVFSVNSSESLARTLAGLKALS
ncbi:MAG: ACP S-malonyltransferase [Lentisphaeria bacterium]